MHAHEAGVFVFAADVMQFVEHSSCRLSFLIEYEVKCELLTTKLMMNAGEIEVDAKMLYGCESEIKAGESEGKFKQFFAIDKRSSNFILISVYKDLLAITSASSMVHLTVKFEKPPKLKLKDFLRSTLKFVQLRDDDEPDQMVNYRDISLFTFL